MKAISRTGMLFLFIAFWGITAPLQGAKADTPMTPEKLYGEGIHFSIWRNGDQIGTHKTKFSRDGDALIVETTVKMRVKILFITAYSMDHTIKETWRNGELEQLAVWTDEDGVISKFNAKREDGRIIVDGPKGQYEAPRSLMTTSHWNRWILDRNVVFNSLTGELNNVTLAKQGNGTVSAGADERSATRYAYTGDLETEIWFDEQGRWVKLRFQAPDDSTIEYMCEACGVAAQ